MIEPYSRVMLVSNKHEAEGCRQGMFGDVIEILANGKYEVEFSAASGITIAQIVLDEAEKNFLPRN